MYINISCRNICNNSLLHKKSIYAYRNRTISCHSLLFLKLFVFRLPASIFPTNFPYIRVVSVPKKNNRFPLVENPKECVALKNIALWWKRKKTVWMKNYIRQAIELICVIDKRTLCIKKKKKYIEHLSS